MPKSASINFKTDRALPSETTHWLTRINNSGESYFVSKNDDASLENLLSEHYVDLKTVYRVLFQSFEYVDDFTVKATEISSYDAIGNELVERHSYESR